MYSGIGTQTLFFALGADDVNMLKMARTGVDWSANTADDYTVNLVNVGSCSNTHEIKVSMASLSVGTLGVCRENDISYSFDPGNPLTARHFSVVFKSPGGPLVIELNSNETWDYATPIFASNFESGDTSAWDDTVP
jgi:hypothetical protein